MIRQPEPPRDLLDDGALGVLGSVGLRHLPVDDHRDLTQQFGLPLRLVQLLGTNSVHNDRRHQRPRRHALLASSQPEPIQIVRLVGQEGRAVCARPRAKGSYALNRRRLHAA